MALVWFDGFDHLANANGSRKYNTFTGTFVSGTSTRFNSGQAAAFSFSQALTKVLTSHQAWRVGVAFYQNSGTNTINLLALYDGGSLQCQLNIENRVIVVRNSGGTAIATSTRVLPLASWVHIEWYQVIADSITTNGCVVMVNGEQWAVGNSGDTKNTANATADRLLMTCPLSVDYRVDDLYIYHDSTTTSPTFSGDLRVVVLSPTGNGNYSQFDGSDGNSTDNYLMVDESTPDDDTTYVQSDVSGEFDSYTMGNLASTPVAVMGVAINTIAKKDDAGARTGRLFFRISGTDYESGSFSPSTSYLGYQYLAEVNPATTAAWTESEVNALETGIKVQS